MSVNVPSDSSHLSDQAKADLIADFTGVVDSRFAKKSIMRNFVQVQSIRGTNTKMIRKVGAGTGQLQKVTDGVRPAATNIDFGKAQVTVDTIILARHNTSLANDFFSDFNVRQELALEQGKTLAQFYDESLLIQAIKAARLPAPSGLNGAFGAGKSKTLGASGDELDPDKLFAAINSVLLNMEEEDIDPEECAIFLRPTMFDVLLNHDKLVSKDFSAADGDFRDGKLMTIRGCPLVVTARIPNAAITGHQLSNENNGNAFDVSATEAKAAAVIMHPQSLLVGETIPLMSKVHYSDVELQWFIDSLQSYGVAPRNQAVTGAVFKA